MAFWGATLVGKEFHLPVYFGWKYCPEKSVQFAIYFSILNLETQSSAFHKNWICYSSDAVWGDIGFQDQGSFWVVWVTEI